MRGNKILLSCAIATGIYCILLVVWGQYGLLAQQQLKDYETKLDARLGALSDQYDSLSRQYSALQTSAEEIKLQARSLGYFSSGEIPVKVLQGQDFHLPSKDVDLSVMVFEKDDETLEAFFRWAWVLLFFLVYFALILVEKLWFPPSERSKAPLSTPIEKALVPVRSRSE